MITHKSDAATALPTFQAAACYYMPRCCCCCRQCRCHPLHRTLSTMDAAARSDRVQVPASSFLCRFGSLLFDPKLNHLWLLLLLPITGTMLRTLLRGPAPVAAVMAPQMPVPASDFEELSRQHFESGAPSTAPALCCVCIYLRMYMLLPSSQLLS
jgi:hypothetical protein